MTNFELYKSAFVILIPTLTAAFGITLTGFSCRDCLSLPEKKLKEGVMLFLLMSLFAWFTIFFYLLIPEVFADRTCSGCRIAVKLRRLFNRLVFNAGSIALLY
ncbi:MAG: hypothetical protein LBD53_10795, partial [Tannerella sp.]|nr:hypothetical protein [Tannerella sp.]